MSNENEEVVNIHEQFKEELVQLVEKYGVLINYSIVNGEFISGGIFGKGDGDDIHGSCRFIIHNTSQTLGELIKDGMIDELFGEVTDGVSH